MYITNNPQIATIAESCGVDRIFIDMEYIGKEERQAGLNTVKSHHTIADIVNIRSVISSSELLVRINPIHEKTNNYGSSKDEIDDAIDAGADILMLPMIRNVGQVDKFVR
jgi:2-keto-3-deoxy-L-rhamnonate aldolase RhmA